MPRLGPPHRRRQRLAGNTGEVNRAPIAVIRLASPSPARRPGPVRPPPYVHKPCRIGRGKPASVVANHGSLCGDCGHRKSVDQGRSSVVAARRRRPARGRAPRRDGTLTGLAAESAFAADDGGGDGFGEVAGVGVDGGAPSTRIAFLPSPLSWMSSTSELTSSRPRRQRRVQPDLLAAVQQFGPVERADLGPPHPTPGRR